MSSSVGNKLGKLPNPKYSQIEDYYSLQKSVF